MLLFTCGILGVAALDKSLSTSNSSRGQNRNPYQTNAPTSTATPTTSPVPMTPFNASEMDRFDSVKPFERRIHELTNERRREHERKPVEWKEDIAYIARVHSRDMAEREYFGHKSPDGNDVADRASRFGLDYPQYGENLHVSAVLKDEGIEDTAKEAVNGWMGSESHRLNLLNSVHDYNGIGVYLNENGRILVTQVLAGSNPVNSK